MIFGIPMCPQCGGPIRGTLETVPGIAEITGDGSAEEEYEYGGYTEICWDGQTTDTDKDGNVTAVCKEGHEWQTSRDE